MKKLDLLRNRIKRVKRYSEELSIYTSEEMYSYSCLINVLMRKMFAKSYLVFLLFGILNANSQNDSIFYKTHSQIFSLSPISRKVDKVNGLVFGVGHFENKRIQNQTINGLNIEVNGAPIAGVFLGFMSIMYLPEIINKE
ncbi:hypothetical protein [uncultured Flavobacterium sp.]|uniref:hypothetical protein n=1 Tax=uncultured Flavobacterium sp. TaxID=165435 RepID=UPI0030EB282C|tara:strand:- start:108300 stop:108719 length:420 start_codon:yes stop_codon:yes gene_type:complete